MIRIDGSHLEGGGSIIRLSTALSCVTGEAVEIRNIRANRTPSGLKTQHFHALLAIAEFCNAELSGEEIGSRKIVFKPGKIDKKKIFVNIPSAGSTTLVLQNLIPAIVLAKKQAYIEVTGGTHVMWSPPAEYFEKVFSYFMKIIGCNMNFKLHEYGFYPKGGGRISLDIKKSNIKPFEFLERGILQRIEATSIATTQLEKARVSERQLLAFRKEFPAETIYGKKKYVESLSAGSNIHANAQYDNTRIGVEMLGEKGLNAENVGRMCAKKLKEELESRAPVDEHMADQLIPFMTPGSKFRTSNITKHTLTNIWVCEQLLNYKYEIKDRVISCKEQ